MKSCLQSNAVDGRPRVLIAEDDDSIVELVIAMLPRGFDLIGVCRNGGEAIRCALDMDPDLILLDLVMPVLDGIQVARELHGINERLRIVMLTGMEDPQFVTAALAAGARGYVFKHQMRTDLLPAIHSVFDGRVFVSCTNPLTA